MYDILRENEYTLFLLVSSDTQNLKYRVFYLGE